MSSEIRYSTDHARHLLDIYVPQAVTDYPVLMFVSGGGWSAGSKEWIANLGTTFAAKGVGVVTVDHRLMPEVQYVEQVEDLAKAFAWLKANIGKYGGDASRLIIGGHSAGGHLISLLAMDERYLAAVGHRTDEITGVIAVSAALDVGNRFGDAPEASPLNHLRAGLPPFLLLWAENDFPQLSGQAKSMQEALQSIGVPVECAELPQRDHFSITHHIGRQGDMATKIINEWLRLRCG